MLTIIVTIIFLLISVQSAIYLCVEFWSKTWPKVPANLIGCQITTNESQIISNRVLYFLSVRYTYEYRGKAYKSSRISINGRYASESLVKVEKLKKELENENFCVFVCPMLNRYSIVVHGVINKLWMYFGLFYGVVMVGLMMGISSIISA